MQRLDASETLSSQSSITVGVGISSVPLVLYQPHAAVTAPSHEKTSGLFFKERIFVKKYFLSEKKRKPYTK